MNNAENEFDKQFRQAEQELTALKTAHQRPLGALNFFEKSAEFNVELTEAYGIYSANITVTVAIKTPSVVPPIVQTGWDVPEGFITVLFYGVETSADYATWTYNLTLTSTTKDVATMNVGTVSSQPIESITWSVS